MELKIGIRRFYISGSDFTIDMTVARVFDNFQLSEISNLLVGIFRRVEIPENRKWVPESPGATKNAIFCFWKF